jgi:tetratricopeptide (TPR) repeat protein
MPEEPSAPPPSRRKTLTPEQRRFMGTQRMKEEPTPEAEDVAIETAEESAPPPPESIAPAPARVEEEGPAQETVAPPRREKITVVRQDVKSSRASELKMAFVVLAVVVLLAAAFYVGAKFQRWRYAFETKRDAAQMAEVVPEKYRGIPANDLVEQAILEERAGNTGEAAEKLIAAKHKDLSYRGILFRAGKMAYDAGDYAGADKLFEQAIKFGENLDFANYFRGLIALRVKDLAAAERFFEAAASADPFTADYFYYWAESLRLDHKPNESIRVYERARLLARNEQDATVCQFKIRMAVLETGDAPRIASEVEQRGSDLPVDWLMTAAALNIQRAKVEDAIELIARARGVEEQRGLFLSCAQDFFFVSASRNNPEIAAACPEAVPPKELSG